MCFFISDSTAIKLFKKIIPLFIFFQPLLPTVFSPSDAGQLLSGCLKSHQGALLCCDTIVASEKLVSECSKPFPALMAKKAEVVSKGKEKNHAMCIDLIDENTCSNHDSHNC